jgi:hypothetical protein
MPRDGSQVYVLPFPDVVPDTTIESPVYNGFTNDVAQDLNAPRPISSGGTGATSAAAALAALGGETASQIVTNYDSFAFKPGSFSSAAGATSAPVAGQAFTGICYMADASNFFIEARSLTDGVLYARGKVAGAWGGWVRNVDAATALMLAGRQTTTGGFRFTNYVVPGAQGGNAGTTFTPDAYNGNYQNLVNAGAHTWAVPANDCAIDVLIWNQVGAGAITFSGYTVGAGKAGDPLTTTSGSMFIVSIRRIASVSTYVVKALQ